jgi:TetR/AcrR family transcriptional regulator, transcriptional repressor for nem operon
MTDSAQTAGSKGQVAAGKRERLIDAAQRMLYEQGVERTTLAEVAEAANVAQGNVYYYFKTKDDLVAAAIARHGEEIRATLEAFETHRTPKARLRALVRMFVERSEEIARLGCPQGTLCSELDKRVDRLSDGCAAMMRLPVAWAERQFKEMGRRDAAELAVALIAAYQGAALLANTFREPELMAREGKRLERWIDGLAAGS